MSIKDFFLDLFTHRLDREYRALSLRAIDRELAFLRSASIDELVNRSRETRIRELETERELL